MKKFFLALALAGLATVSLAGCSGNEVAEEATTEESEVVEEVVVPEAEEVAPAVEEAAPAVDAPVAE